MNWLKNIFGQNRTRDPLGNGAMVSRGTLKVDFDFSEYASRHIFNRLSENSEYGFYYFPFGYLFRYPRWGTINEMGFRQEHNTYEIRRMNPDKIIIAVFGGSTTFSILVDDKDTFCAQLEVMLNNNHELVSRAGGHFKVVNFGQSGNLVLHQIVNFNLYCHELEPDIVISHSGANDFVYPQITDRNLLSNYQISYVDAFECWGRKLHDTGDIELAYDHANPTKPDFRPVLPSNRPEDVLNNYHSRVKQFARLARGFGAMFISGFQPWLISKAKLTEDEERDRRKYYPYYQHVYANVPLLCEKYEDILARENPDFIINLHRRFATLRDEASHFRDMLHTLPAGDRVIAQEYYRKIVSIYMSDGRESSLCAHQRN